MLPILYNYTDLLSSWQSQVIDTYTLCDIRFRTFNTTDCAHYRPQDIEQIRQDFEQVMRDNQRCAETCNYVMVYPEALCNAAIDALISLLSLAFDKDRLRNLTWGFLDIRDYCLVKKKEKFSLETQEVLYNPASTAATQWQSNVIRDHENCDQWLLNTTSVVCPYTESQVLERRDELKQIIQDNQRCVEECSYITIKLNSMACESKLNYWTQFFKLAFYKDKIKDLKTGLSQFVDQCTIKTKSDIQISSACAP